MSKIGQNRSSDNWEENVWRRERIRKKNFTSASFLCVIVLCGAFPLRTHFYCDSAEQAALHGGDVPFHSVLAKTPTLNNCSHSEVGREALMGSVRKCVLVLTLGSLRACESVCVWRKHSANMTRTLIASHLYVMSVSGPCAFTLWQMTNVVRLVDSEFWIFDDATIASMFLHNSHFYN